ncbi:hypothetical protein LXT12_15755 [Pelomonas sp. P7]|uniref:PqqD family protein, HPr-rel-A system n=1 Tax=Pelomonas caseinilytica TaxID=2906763 RepID=A0ABS8XIE0_9BURK|nr:hypothetical protein [Pelomonas sp. P7]MCE4538707.1 hypothetical protein [Pelomonas sp. P7]
MTRPPSSSPPRWTLTHGADLSIHVWGDDCLVHHALSNDTHRLAAWLVPALRRLGQQPPATLEELATLMEADEDSARDALEQLERLLLVEPC